MKIVVTNRLKKSWYSIICAVHACAKLCRDIYASVMIFGMYTVVCRSYNVVCRMSSVAHSSYIKASSRSFTSLFIQPNRDKMIYLEDEHTRQPTILHSLALITICIVYLRIFSYTFRFASQYIAPLS